MLWQRSNVCTTLDNFSYHRPFKIKPAIRGSPRQYLQERLLTEGMRLYPPTWVLDRETIEDYETCVLRIPSGSPALPSHWVTDHDHCYFPEPFHFDPER
jgi:cytochrome P450